MIISDLQFMIFFESVGSRASLSAIESCKSQDLWDFFYSDFRVSVKVRLLCSNKRH